jgi:hypothetical protein
VYILVKNVLDGGLPILVLLMFLSKGKKRHHDLSVEDNNILLTIAQKSKKEIHCCVHFTDRQEGRGGALHVCT